MDLIVSQSFIKDEIMCRFYQFSGIQFHASIFVQVSRQMENHFVSLIILLNGQNFASSFYCDEFFFQSELFCSIDLEKRIHDLTRFVFKAKVELH